ncbi:MAG: thiamine pyrophosphate-dependent enzyme [bacterium]|nr:thiamine pyrophosphate-dependent enzyme [bacterium]
MIVHRSKKFNTRVKPTWCPGCGDYSIWHALKMTISENGWEPHQFCVVYDIGCSGNMCSFINAYGFHGLHGRSLPVAAGIKISNHELPLIVIGGDGGLYGEGMGHFIHFMRANHDITMLVHDNQIYGLTTGQTSPTTEKGQKTKSNPIGGIEIPINPLVMAIASGATFVARGFAGDTEGTAALIKKAIAHKGFSLVDVFQPCVTFNKHNTYEWYKERIYDLSVTDYVPNNQHAAFGKAMEFDKLPIGVIYEDTSRLTYEEELPQLKDKPLIKNDNLNRDISAVLKSYM